MGDIYTDSWAKKTSSICVRYAEPVKAFIDYAISSESSFDFRPYLKGFIALPELLEYHEHPAAISKAAQEYLKNIDALFGDKPFQALKLAPSYYSMKSVPVIAVRNFLRPLVTDLMTGC